MAHSLPSGTPWAEATTCQVALFVKSPGKFEIKCHAANSPMANSQLSLPRFQVGPAAEAPWTQHRGVARGELSFPSSSPFPSLGSRPPIYWGRRRERGGKTSILWCRCESFVFVFTELVTAVAFSHGWFPPISHQCSRAAGVGCGFLCGQGEGACAPQKT